MRRVFFLDAASSYGGAQRSLRTLLFGLRKYELDIHLATACQPLLERLNGPEIVREVLPTTPWRRSLAGCVRAARDILRFRSWFRERCRELQPELIYANGIQAGLLVAFGGMSDAKLLFHHRDCRCPSSALRRVVRRAERTVVLSDFMVQHTRESVGPQLASRLVAVPNGFDYAELRQQAKAAPAADLPADRTLAVLVADMVKWKRHDLFLKAIAAAQEVVGPMHAVLVGGARDAAGEKWLASLQRQALALGLAEHVSFCGHVDNPLPLMQAAHVVCSVADDEPFGRTIVEAAALGKPLVVTRGGGPEELVKGLANVRVVGARPDEIAEGIEAVRGQDQEPPLAWLERFSAERHAARLLEIMSEIS